MEAPRDKYSDREADDSAVPLWIGEHVGELCGGNCVDADAG